MRKPYKITGTRCSLLSISQFCGKAAELSEAHGAGRPAAMSLAFHAQMAGETDAEEKLARLSEEEREEIAQWKPPSTCYPIAGVTLDYASAAKEQAIGLGADGEWVEPNEENPSEALTAGTLDFAWIREVNGWRVAYVADMKKTPWTTLDGPKSLQLLAYGWAWAKKNNCDAFCCGLWFLEDGGWNWGALVDMTSWDALDIWSLIRHAAENRGEASTGAHCRDCYGRMHCEEHLLPVALADTQLRAFTHPESLTEETVARAVLYAQAAQDLAKAVLDNAKEWQRRGHGLVRDAEAGKVWREVEMPGKRSLTSLDQLIAAIPAAEKFVKQGGTYSQFRWVKG